jgi:hypothetical protein
MPSPGSPCSSPSTGRTAGLCARGPAVPFNSMRRSEGAFPWRPSPPSGRPSRRSAEEADQQVERKIEDGMRPGLFRTLEVVAGAIFATGVIAGKTTPATADLSYPWCAQGDTLHCYFTTREQCELTEDYRGFCVANPDAQPQTNRATPSFAVRARSSAGAPGMMAHRLVSARGIRSRSATGPPATTAAGNQHYSEVLLRDQH